MTDTTALQAKLDKKYPGGIHVHMLFGSGGDEGGVAILIPRAIALDDGQVLLSPFNDTIWFLVPADSMKEDGDTTTFSMGTRTFTLTPASPMAQSMLSEDVKKAHAPGFAEEKRGMTP